MFQECIPIAVVAVFGNFHIHRRPIECDFLASGIYQMSDGSESSHIVIYNYTRTIHACTYSIIEYERYTIIHQFLEMIILLGVLGLRDDNATHLILIEVFTNSHFLIIPFVTLRHHHTIAAGASLFLYTRDNRHKVIMYELRYDNSNYLHRLYLTMSQGFTDHVRIEVVRPGISLDTLLLNSTDTRAVLQRSTHSSYATSEIASDIFHCYGYNFFHNCF